MNLRRGKKKYSDKMLSQHHSAHYNSIDMAVDRTQTPFTFLEVGRWRE